MALGDRIRELRRERALSLREFARRAHISHSFLSDIEGGRSMPSVSTLLEITAALGVSVADILETEAGIGCAAAPDSSLHAILHNPSFIEAARDPDVRAVLTSPDTGVYLKAAASLSRLDAEKLASIPEAVQTAKKRVEGDNCEKQGGLT